MNKRRPIAITILAWVLILLSITSLIASYLLIFFTVGFSSLQNWIEATKAFGLIIPLGIASIICGVGLRQARNWARWLCLILPLPWIVHQAVSIPFSLLLTIPGYLVLIYFLMNKKASDYFAKK